jgi:4-hydroxy-3-methylbut-2-en-1-yl diphosphate reductase
VAPNADKMSVSPAASPGSVAPLYFQRGFGLKHAVSPLLARSYRSAVVDHLKTAGYEITAGGLRVKLAREFGFCYGVDRAVEYAYETRLRFPDRRIFVSGEIIHNGDVNARLRQMDLIVLPSAAADPAVRYADVRSHDVVILPAFGVTADEMAFLSATGCVLVDTTCGSVLNVWKMVHRSARDGFTVVIHGKYAHEETRATASQALTHPGGRYLCVRDVTEADVVCAFVRGQVTAGALRARFAAASSPGFDPDRDLERIGLANQTTMLMGESLEIQERLRAAMRDRFGEAGLTDRFRAFDTICSATQDRQDAVRAMLDAGGLDVMIVIGGINSSNTQALAAMCAPTLPTFHIDDAECIAPGAIRHYAPRGGGPTMTEGWLPNRPVTVGLTAGASTPDSIVGAVVERLLSMRGFDAADLVASGRS